MPLTKKPPKDRSKPKRKVRSDKGTRKSLWDTRSCKGCGNPVTRRVSDFTQPTVYCGQACWKKYGAPNTHGGRPWTDTTIVRKYDGVLRTVAVMEGGYRAIYWPDHQNANSRGRVLEHRYVMSKILGRPLYSNERVRHKDCNPENNRRSNLELWVTGHPTGARIEDAVEWAVKLLRRYAPEKLR